MKRRIDKGKRSKALVGVLFVIVFLFSSPGVGISGEGQELVEERSLTSDWKQVDNIRIETRYDQNTGIADTVTGDLDALLNVIKGPTYQEMNEEWKAQLEVLESYKSYNTLYFNPAWTEGSRVETDIIGDGDPEDLRFNPLSIEEVRYATNWIIDRQYIVEEIYEGYAQYESIGPVYPTYEEHILPIVEEHGLRPPMPPDDFEYGYEMIQDAMEAQITNPDLQGDLRGPEHSPTGFWQYRPPGKDWMDVETKGLIRIDDERYEIGHMFADLLEECHIKVDRIDGDRSLIDIWLFTDPADMEWSWYTGGWVRPELTAYPHLLPVSFYTDYFDYMPGSGNMLYPPTRYWYVRDEPYAQPLIDEYAEPLMSGKLPDEGTYWEYVRHITDVGMSRSVRVFLTSPMDVVVYNENNVKEVASESVNGWSNVFSPRTIKTVDGSFTPGILDSGILLWIAFNTIDGEGDLLMRTQQHMSQDYATYTHPGKGTTMPMRADFIAPEGISDQYDGFERGDMMVRKNYSFDEEGALIGNLTIPEGAWFYDVQSQEWIQGGHTYEQTEEGADLVQRDKAASAVTYQYHLGKWHSGHEFTLRDIVAWHAFSKQLSYGEDWGAVGGEYFHSGWGNSNRYYHQNVVALEIDEENGMITYYGDYTSPHDDKIASYYAEIPEVPWQLLEAVSHLRGETDLADSDYTEHDVYEWSNIPGANWVHWLCPQQTIDFGNTLQNMADAGWIPPYLQGGPTPISEGRSEDEIDAIRSFQSEYQHSWITQGPFQLTLFDNSIKIMELERWDGYPFPDDHWNHELAVKDLVHGDMSAPTEIYTGQDFTTDIRVFVSEEYPEVRTRDLNPEVDDYVSMLTVYDHHGTEVYKDQDPEFINTDGSYFEVTIPGTETMGWEEGTYEIEFISWLEGQEQPEISSQNVEVMVSQGELVDHHLAVEPVEGVEPLEVNITAGAENIGGTNVSEDVYIDDQIVYTLDVPPFEYHEETFKYTFEHPGTYEVRFDEEEVVVTVDEAFFIPDNLILDVDPITGDAPLEVTINVSAENQGNTDGEVDVIVDGDTVYTLEIPANEGAEHEFDHTFEDPGIYTVEFGDEVVEVEVNEPLPVLVNYTLTVEPTSGDAPLEVTINVSAENQGNVDGEVDVIVDGDTVYIIEIPANEGVEHEFDHTFEDPGIYTVEFGDEVVEVEVNEPLPVLVNYTLTVEPTSGDAPLEVTINVSAENQGDAHGSIDLVINETVVYTLEVPAQGSAYHQLDHTFDEHGEYVIEFGDEVVEVEVREIEETPDTFSPPLVLGIIVVVILAAILMIIFFKMYNM